MGDPETKVDAAALIAAEKAEHAAKRQQEIEEAKKVIGDGKVIGAGGKVLKLDMTQGARVRGIVAVLDRPKEKPKTNGAGQGFTFKDAKEEPKKGKNGAEEEEALRAEAPTATSDLGPEEMKRRRIIRWKKLQEINRECAVIRSFGGKCVIVTQGRCRYDENRIVYDYQTRQAFEQWKANDFIPSLEKINKTEVVGPWWWRHPKREQYDGVVFKPPRQLLFAPGPPPKLVKTPDGKRLLNTYRGWGVEPKQGDWSLIREHILNVLADGDAKTDKYITNWAAWAIQHPDRKAEAALVFIGEKGSGKGSFGRVLYIIFGNHSFQASSLEHVVGKFNAHKENCILFIADEAYWGGHKSATGELQRMITEETLPIERKGFDIYEARNYIHMLMLAEPGWVIPAGKFERRYAAFGVSHSRMDDTPYFKALHHQIDNGGAAAMLYDLQRKDLGDWHPREIHKTAALRHQQELTLQPLDEWMLGLLEDGELPGTLPGRPREARPTTLLQDAQHKVSRLHDLGKMKLAGYLKEQWGCTPQGGVERRYSFPPLSEMRKEWDKRFGPREWPPIGDWGHYSAPPLADLLDEKV